MLAYLFVVLAVLFRLTIPFLQSHPWHFTPVAASLLFFGAYGSRRQLWIPVALLGASDVVLNKFVYAYPLTWDLVVTWAWYAAVVALGMGLSKHLKPLWIISSALASSVSFFLLSNFVVWLAYDMYPKTFSGLIACFVAAIPFFRGTFASDLLFTPILFAVPFAIKALSERTGTAGSAAA
ncbi:MAG TPA: DUF6580 family putative transport protein [Terriglobales bacterium]|nr:DUF6580 family putative transport protein [Terriglobales bacterium]